MSSISEPIEHTYLLQFNANLQNARMQSKKIPDIFFGNMKNTEGTGALLLVFTTSFIN